MGIFGISSLPVSRPFSTEIMNTVPKPVYKFISNTASCDKFANSTAYCDKFESSAANKVVNSTTKAKKSFFNRLQHK